MNEKTKNALLSIVASLVCIVIGLLVGFIILYCINAENAVVLPDSTPSVSSAPCILPSSSTCLGMYAFWLLWSAEPSGEQFLVSSKHTST